MTRPARRPDRIPVPGPGQVARHRLPAGIGNEFILTRMIKMVQAGRRDPLVITTARKIAELSVAAARQDGRRAPTGGMSGTHVLDGIHAWGREHFEYVDDPAGIELIQTPARMLRQLEVPRALHEAFWDPIRRGMTAGRRKQDWSPRRRAAPAPRITGDSDEAAVLALALAAAVGISPLRFGLGGHDGSLHYAWGEAYADGAWRIVDLLHEERGAHPTFETVSSAEIPL